MNVYHHWDKVDIEDAIITIGSFDGVHLGHQSVLDFIKEKSNELNGKSTLVTFHPHPRFIIQKNSSLKLIQTVDEKIDSLEKLKIDELVIIPFSEEWAKLNAEDFLRLIFKKIKPKAFYIGYDHKFGKNREGDFELVKKLSKEFNYIYDQLPELDHNEKISSTSVRDLIKEGSVLEANSFLGKPYRISGTVVFGDQIGNTINFPTANIQINEEYKLIPKLGAYAVKVFHDDVEYKGMLNIGKRPTVNGNKVSIEVNIFEFNKNIYGDKISVEFVERIRNEVKFKNLEELQTQLIKDKDASIQILS